MTPEQQQRLIAIAKDLDIYAYQLKNMVGYTAEIYEETANKGDWAIELVKEAQGILRAGPPVDSDIADAIIRQIGQAKDGNTSTT